MTTREALDALMSGIANIEDYEEALEIMNGMVNGQQESNSMWEQRYHGLREAYEKKWGNYTADNGVRSVVDESISSGFTREDAYEKPVGLRDLDMSFDGSTE